LTLAIGKETSLRESSIFLHHINRALPPLKLGGVELAEVEQAPLKHAGRRNASAFTKRIMDMELPVFLAKVTFEKHSPEIIPNCRGRKRG
jgi:hypothetical protein